MSRTKKKRFFVKAGMFILVMFAIFSMRAAFGADLVEIRERGKLHHLGVPYASFVTGSGDGMDVELVRLFAEYLGVKYEYIETSWKDAIGDLSGKMIKADGANVKIFGNVPIRGDILANGLTILPWRKKVIDFSTPTFPTQVWLMAVADSPMKPISPSGDVIRDIKTTKAKICGRSVLGKLNTCLDPALYKLRDVGAKVILFRGNLNELAPAIINGEAEATILDVPDALVALEKWPARIKVVGPISNRQEIGVGFAKTSSRLRDAFNQFLEKCKEDGTYHRLVKKYYPDVFMYYPAFFQKK